MKKRIALLLCFALLLPCLLLASCGGGATGGEDATGAPTGACWITFSINGEDHVYLVANGETPVCPEELLSWETEEHYYKVTGWDKAFVPADADTTYTATVGEYGLTLYDVRFNLPSGIVKVPTHEGETPTPPKGYETDLSRVDKVGNFDHWTPALEAPTAENMEGKNFAIYTPVYLYNEARYYDVTFDVMGVLYTERVKALTTPVCPVDPADPVKDSIALYFAGWNETITEAKKDVTYVAEYKSYASILPAKNGAKGIFTMTYDDGRYYTAQWVNEENKKYGLTGSCMMVPNWNQCNPDFTYDGGSIAKWNALFADGTLEPQSHSTSHEGKARFPDESCSIWEDCKYNNYQENYQYELVQAVTELKKAFPNFDPICFAPSNNILSRNSYKSDGNGNLVKENGNYVLVNDGGAAKVAEATYYAIRKGNRVTVQTLDPAPDDNAGGWYNLAIKAFKDFSGDEKLTQGKKWLDDAANDGTWLIVMCHGITTTGGDIKQSLADQFFAHAGQYVEKGILWSATFGEATKYIRERQSTTVSERYENNVVYVDMTINRTTADGKPLPENVFNYPLTVEVRVPDDWHTVYYRVNGQNEVTSVYVRDGVAYAMVNLIPGADGAKTATAIRFVN